MNTILNRTWYSFSHSLARKYHSHIIKLPPRNLRLMGEKFYDDDYYFKSSLAEGDRFVNKLHVNQNSEILELGCSSGRSVIGLIERSGRVKRYVGVDMKLASISWCNKYIASRSGFCHFQYIDLYSTLYNPTGKIKLDKDFRLDFEPESFDIVYVQSVLPNYYSYEIRILAKEFYRLLKKGGTLFLTSFVEENVPPETENPEGYVMVCNHPRQIIRYEKNYFIELIAAQGFTLSVFEPHTEIDNQSALYFAKASG